MKKDIKDYLHLYLGCPAEIHGYNTKIVDKVTSSSLTMITKGCKIVPILRPLSDMTEQEAMELGKLLLLIPHGQISAYKNTFGKWCVKWSEHYKDHWCIDGEIFNQHQTIYLLKEGFDLFELIADGLAIDKTTLNK